MFEIILGFFVLLAASICQGSFGLGYKKYNPFSWASFWGIYCLLCILVSVSVTWILAPGLWEVVAQKGIAYFLLPIFCGCLWGLSAVGFSKGIDLIGMSLVYGISMGISTVVGSVLPMLLDHSFPQGVGLFGFVMELLLTIIGVGIVTLAGVRRDKMAKSSVAGVLMAIFSGLGSGAMNLGFRYTEGISQAFAERGYSQAAMSAGKWLPVLVGGCLCGTLWCIFEVTLKKEWGTITEKGSLSRVGKLFGVSLVWYAALMLYGLSVDMLGSMGSTAGWLLFNALALVISVGWGIKTGEWKDAGKNKKLLYVGCLVLMIAWVFTGLL